MANLISKIKTPDNVTYDIQDKISTFGGTNLLKNTSDEWTTLTMPATSYYTQFGTDYELEVGETYTFSILIEKTSTDTNPINVHCGNGTINNYTHDITSWRKNSITSGEKIILTHTVESSDKFNSNGTTAAPYFAFRIRNEQKAMTVRYKDIKLEKGNKSTDWTPAPQDLVTYNGTDTIEFFQ